jgi:hypothetical protein
MGNLVRYGLKWNGPQDFVATEMDDGHWTHWHLADKRIKQLEAELSESFMELTHDKVFAKQNARIDELETKINQSKWRDIKSAPKGATKKNPYGEHWILGINRFNEQKVIRWCMEHPCNEGVWMVNYIPTDYIDGIQQFKPTHWTPLLEPIHVPTGVIE